MVKERFAETEVKEVFIEIHILVQQRFIQSQLGSELQDVCQVCALSQYCGNRVPGDKMD